MLFAGLRGRIEEWREERRHNRRFRGWPWAIAKACEDRWQYQAGLVTGQIVQFEEAELLPGGDVVRLLYATPIFGFPCEIVGFHRGLEVRREALAWALDFDS